MKIPNPRGCFFSREEVHEGVGISVTKWIDEGSEVGDYVGILYG